MWEKPCDGHAHSCKKVLGIQKRVFTSKILEVKREWQDWEEWGGHSNLYIHCIRCTTFLKPILRGENTSCTLENTVCMNNIILCITININDFTYYWHLA